MEQARDLMPCVFPFSKKLQIFHKKYICIFAFSLHLHFCWGFHSIFFDECFVFRDKHPGSITIYSLFKPCKSSQMCMSCTFYTCLHMVCILCTCKMIINSIRYHTSLTNRYHTNRYHTSLMTPLISQSPDSKCCLVKGLFVCKKTMKM